MIKQLKLSMVAGAIFLMPVLASAVLPGIELCQSGYSAVGVPVKCLIVGTPIPGSSGPNDKQCVKISGSTTIAWNTVYQLLGFHNEGKCYFGKSGTLGNATIKISSNHQKGTVEAYTAQPDMDIQLTGDGSRFEPSGSSSPLFSSVEVNILKK